MSKIVVFGTGQIAELARFYFTNDSDYEVVAFTVDKAYIDQDAFCGKPVIAFEEIATAYPSESYDMFIALSYAKMNKIREQKYHEAKAKGYNLVSYVSSRCSYLSQFTHGDNCFIFEDNTIQPFVKIGNNVTLWSGNHIGHHSAINDHNFISSHVVISGQCTIESNCFLGVNSTVGHNVIVAKETLVGAGAIIVKNTEEKGVYLPPKSVKFPKTSDSIRL